MKAFISACAGLVLSLAATGAGATDSDVIRTFEKNGKISFLMSGDAPAGITLPGVYGSGHRCLQDYPVHALLHRQPGKVTLSMTVTPQGRVENAIVANVDSAEFAAPSLACVRDWVYSPARRNGQPIAVQHTVEIVWILS